RRAITAKNASAHGKPDQSTMRGECSAGPPRTTWKTTSDPSRVGVRSSRCQRYSNASRSGPITSCPRIEGARAAARTLMVLHGTGLNERGDGSGGDMERAASPRTDAVVESAVEGPTAFRLGSECSIPRRDRDQSVSLGPSDGNHSGGVGSHYATLRNV